MSTILGIMGQSGHGKTTAMRTLTPETTYYIDADRKGLSWKGFKHQYSERLGNYIRESDPAKVWDLLQKANDNPRFKTVVVDSVNAIMVDDEMNRMKETGYDKWAELAGSVYEMISEANVFRDDLVIIFVFHAEDLVDENGDHFVRFLTSGRKLQKINLESKFTIVLYARALEDKFVFETQARNSTAKSPMGLFDDLHIPNDIGWVLKKLHEYQEDNVIEVPDFEMKLIQIMEKHNVSNGSLIDYCISKGWLQEGQKLLDLRPDLVEAMLIPKNWDKVLKAVANVENPSIDNAKICPQAKAVRTMMELSGITALDLEKYLLDKGMIEQGQRWHDAQPTLLAAMSQNENWEKVSTKIKGE